ncbi:MAG: 50S ribosomal protein L4 [Acidimicrobiia bacterium]|nr:50S ribosomal protein L4 [Acidimicrobiia bacterium]
MAEITAPLYSSTGDKKGEIALDPTVFGIEPNMNAMHQVVTAQLAGARAGSASTKTRGEVRGGGRKPWRQKGLGRARHGSIRSPQWKGGGVVHGPKPRSYDQRTPKKMKRLALRSALSARASESAIRVVETIDWSTPKTKQGLALLGSMGCDTKTLIVLGRHDTVAERSFRNLTDVVLRHPGHVTTYDVLWSDTVVFTTDTVGAAAGAGAYAVADDDFVRDADGGEEE